MSPQNDAEISEDEVRRELESVLLSPIFARTDRLQRFLQYVCERTLNGEASAINEYLIGNVVFQRGPDYSPNEDSVVRRQAHTLRRKLQEYYEEEGRNSSIRIELPVGRYVPMFRRREADVGPPPTPVDAPLEVPARPAGPDIGVASGVRPRRWVWMAAGGSAIVLFLAGWVAALATHPDRLSRLDSPVAEIWGDWLRDPEGMVICFSNPLSAGMKYLPEPLPPDTVPKHVPLNDEQAAFVRQAIHLGSGGYLYLGPGFAQAKMGEAIGAASLTALFAKAGAPVRTTQSRFVTWDDLPRMNLIVMGSDDVNRWVDPLLEHHPFGTVATSAAQPRAILNTKPEPGEKSEYRVEYAPDQVELLRQYVLISMIPGVDGRRKLLLISGLGTQATQSAAEFLTTNTSLGELLAALRKGAPRHVGPWRFQALLSTEVHDKVPTKTTMLAVRVLN
jgi:hypothetical protein